MVTGSLQLTEESLRLLLRIAAGWAGLSSILVDDCRAVFYTDCPKTFNSRGGE
jgi:hypothetical protein